jgi:membrane protein YdbS with pleckstrin-like domain
MALVKCPECEQQVSTGATSCPHCGMVLTREAPAGSISAGGVAFVPGAAPAGPEQILWEGGPSVALVYGKILRIVIRAVILYTIGYLILQYALPAIQTSSADLRAFIENNGSTLDWAIFGILTILLVPSVAALATAIAQLKNTHYKVTNQRILVEHGVLSRTLEEIDMRSVDDIEFRQSFVERLFKIGAVWIVSTDKVAPKMMLHGIHDPRNTRELIRATAYQDSQRQLFTRST